MPIHQNKSLIEIALDDGQICAGRKTTPIAEVEIELKRGDLTDLFKLARRIGRIVPLRLAFQSKSERGYDMLSRKADISVRATKIELQRHLSAGAAFQIIARSALRHLAANEQAVHIGDSDGVHQMRVGIRRLRVAISIFSELLTDTQTKKVKAELKWLTGELQLVRDLDVYIETEVESLPNTKRRKRGLKKFMSELAIRRGSAVRKLKQSIGSSRYRSLILDTLQWIEAGDWLNCSTNTRKQPIRHYAAISLTRQTKRILKKQSKLPDRNERRLHKLRIAFKKLRYSSDFFGSLFVGRKNEKRRARFNNCLKFLQNDLGTLNDISAHRKLKTSNQLPTSQHFTGLVSRREQQKVAPLLKRTIKAAHNFSKAKRFWAH